MIHQHFLCAIEYTYSMTGWLLYPVDLPSGKYMGGFQGTRPGSLLSGASIVDHACFILGSVEKPKTETYHRHVLYTDVFKVLCKN